MQVPLFARAENLERALDLVAGRLDPLAFECVPYRELATFVAACEPALAGVVFSRRTDPDFRRRLATLREEIAAGIVWVQGRCLGRSCVPEGVEGVLSLHARDLDRDPVRFPARFHQARTGGFLRGQAGRVARAPHLTRDLRRFAVNGLLADPPHSSNTAYARACRVDRGRLEFRFREAPGLTPKRLCQAVLTVHIGMRRPFGCSWEWLAKELGIDAQRFHRATRKHLGCTPSEAEGGHGELVMTWFGDFLTAAFGLPRLESTLSDGTSGERGWESGKPGFDGPSSNRP